MSPSTPHSGKSSSPALRLEMLDGSIGLLPSALPDSRPNTLVKAVLADFDALARQRASRRDLRGLILRSGKPGMFIAGADLRELGSAGTEPNQVRAMVRRGLEIIAAFE